MDRMSNDASRSEVAPERPRRADARKNSAAILRAAKGVFAESGVDAPTRDIANRAEVGVGTLYRNFPKRADLIAAVFRQEVDACADAAEALARNHPPDEAVERWMQRYVDFLVAKRGLASALHSGDDAFKPLPAYFDARLEPALQSLLGSATDAGALRDDITAYDLLRAVAGLCMPSGHGDVTQTRRLVALLVDGLRYRPD